ncbi:MAG: sugar ABC transporter permease, partial [Clostridia bacterium]
MMGTAARPKKSFYHRYIKPYWYLYLMLLPAMLCLAVFAYGPMPGVLLAFKKYSARKGIWGSAWVGLKNYKMLFSYADFYLAIQNTLIISAGRLLLEFPASIVLALLLN